MKVLRFFLAVLLSLAIFTLVSFLNIELLFSSADKAKTMFRKSNLYPLVATGIRNNLADQENLPIDKGAFTEFTNEAINDSTVQTFLEDFLDQFYSIINTPGKELKITLHFSSLRNNVSAILAKNKVSSTQEINQFLTDRDVDLSGNPFVVILANTNKILIGAGITTLVLLILLLLSGSWSQKLIWLGVAFILSGLTFLSETFFYYFGMTGTMVEKIAKMSELSDDKFILAAKKLVVTVAEFQRLYYLIVTIVAVILSVLFIVIGRLLRKDVADSTLTPTAPTTSTVPATVPAPAPTPSAPTKPVAPPAPAKPVPAAKPSAPAKTEKKNAASLPDKVSAGAGAPASEGMRGTKPSK